MSVALMVVMRVVWMAAKLAVLTVVKKAATLVVKTVVQLVVWMVDCSADTKELMSAET